jgi:hypothetical protein
MLTMMVTSFKERARRSSFWLLMGAVVVLAVLATPRFDTAMKVMVLAPKIYRQADNPTWLPVCAASIFGTFLPLFGFGVVANALQTDREQGVWPWVETTHFARLRYGFAHFGANCLILLTMLLLTILATGAMMVLRFPGQGMPAATFISPFLVLIPSIILLASLALLGESVTAKRHNGLIAIYMFSLFYVFALQLTDPTNFWNLLLNLSGNNYVQDVIDQSSIQATGHPITSMQLLSNYRGPQGTHTLVMTGVHWTRGMLLMMLGEIMVALAIAGVAALLMHRARRWRKVRQAPKQPATIETAAVHFSPVAANRFSWPALLRSETGRQWRGRSRLYRLALLAGWLVVWVMPDTARQQAGLPLLWLLSLPWLSDLGTAPHDWIAWLPTMPYASQRQKFAELIVGAGTAVILMLPFLVHGGAAVSQLLLFALANAFLAQGLASLLNNGRLFTMLLAVFWFIYMNGVPGMISFNRFSLAESVVYSLIIVTGLGLTAVAGYRRRHSMAD